MDNKTRAEKIVNLILDNHINTVGESVDIEDGIASARAILDEAVAEEFAMGALDQQRRCAKHCEQQRQEGFASAREKAAGIVAKGDKYCNKRDCNYCDLAEQIRKISPLDSPVEEQESMNPVTGEEY